jgi:hypothetical protein
MNIFRKKNSSTAVQERTTLNTHTGVDTHGVDTLGHDTHAAHTMHD